MTFYSGGGAQTNDVNSDSAQQINNNARVGNIGRIAGNRKVDQRIRYYRVCIRTSLSRNIQGLIMGPQVGRNSWHKETRILTQTPPLKSAHST